MQGVVSLTASNADPPQTQQPDTSKVTAERLHLRMLKI